MSVCSVNAPRIPRQVRVRRATGWLVSNNRDQRHFMLLSSGREDEILLIRREDAHPAGGFIARAYCVRVNSDLAALGKRMPDELTSRAIWASFDEIAQKLLRENYGPDRFSSAGPFVFFERWYVPQEGGAELLQRHNGAHWREGEWD